MVKDAIEALNSVGEAIEKIRTVAEAVKDGREYLKAKHADVGNDLVAMCTEMRNTCTAVAAASSVLTHFRFTVTGSAVDQEPARFNNHLIQHKAMAAAVTASLQALRGHCHKIQHHAQKLQEKANSFHLGKILGLFGLASKEREAEFLQSLQQIYDEEMHGYLLVKNLAAALVAALNDVGLALGPPGTMLPANVTKAASLLGEYAVAFGKVETEANYLALEIQQSIDALDEKD